MIALFRRIFECCGDILGVKQGIIRENFLTARAGGEQVQDVLDAKSADPEGSGARRTGSGRQ